MFRLLEVFRVSTCRCKLFEMKTWCTVHLARAHHQVLHPEWLNCLLQELCARWARLQTMESLVCILQEDYVEYSRHGTVIKGAEKPVVRSKYEEDVFTNNHTVSWRALDVWERHLRVGVPVSFHSVVLYSFCTKTVFWTWPVQRTDSKTSCSERQQAVLADMFCLPSQSPHVKTQVTPATSNEWHDFSASSALRILCDHQTNSMHHYDPYAYFLNGINLL